MRHRAIDPQTPSTLYVGVQTYVSGSRPSPGYTFNFTIYPQGMDTVYVAAASYDRGGALWKSTDGGRSWRNLWPSSSINVYAVIVAPDAPTVVYAGTDTGVLKSTDGGANWTPIPGSPGYTQVLAFDPQDTDTLYAAGPAGLLAITFSGPEAGRTE